MTDNLAVLWDFQNVTPSGDNVNILVGGLLSYCETIGNISYLLAVGDWRNKIAYNVPSILSESGFELLYIPQLNERGKKLKDSVDFIIITKATEMIFQYPHINTYVILTGDVDFRPLVQLLKRHGKTVIIIYNPDNVSERLLEFANDHKDYRDLIPDETDEAEKEKEILQTTKNFSKEEAFKLLNDAITQMEAKKKLPTPGSVKVRMKMINDNFKGEIDGVKYWMEFINDAKAKGHIDIKEKNNDLTLANTVIKSSEKDIFDIFVDMMKKISKEKRWINFNRINQKMIEENIHIADFHYTQFKKLAIEAENRSLIEIKNEGFKWSARLK
jgi:uncharacterized LabA/DUF88 family protein